MRRALMIVGFMLGLYLVARAIAEPFVIDVTDPATYRDTGRPQAAWRANRSLPSRTAGGRPDGGYLMRRASPNNGERPL